MRLGPPKYDITAYDITAKKAKVKYHNHLAALRLSIEPAAMGH